ncbi:M43 family zinc metalloprotease [Bizionia sediminis]|uniref:M43 family zinc metalloprotease n=1 Tax=Bizionia sediminis TaxID=1737064 RepID=A0ABW5KTM6_9FLAO
MKQNNLKVVWLLLLSLGVFSIQAQQKSAPNQAQNETLQLTPENQRHLQETGYVRCVTEEMDALRRQNNPNLPSKDAFEEWLAPLILEREQRIANQIANGTYRNTEVNIPIIFHVITGSQGDANDISAARIQAQIDQLNLDFNNLSGSTHPAAASAQINFIPAQVDPNGVLLPEPGINRVYGYPGTITTNQMDATIKPATIWDRSLYANIWSANLSGGVLGYAQFPSNSTLPGMPQNGGSALTDGVVVIPGSIGSLANPGTAAPYNAGRTLTHEIGHWIGLRHIWGDSNCGNDFCPDTPQSTSSNFGCPTNQTTCDNIRDMVENYMDYTNDACMNIFTADQVSRMLTVLENADGISNLPNSTTGNTAPVIGFSTLALEGLEGTGCAQADITIPMAIGMAPSADATVTFSLSGTATNLADYELITPSVTFPAGSNANQNLTLRVYQDGFIETDETIVITMSLTTTGDATLSPNGSTFTYTILDDDIAPADGSVQTIFNDDFESYTNFIIENIGDWITLDLDGLPTYAGGVEDPTYPNVFSPMAFQIFNPSATTPTAATNSAGADGENRNFDPRSGAKYAASWAGIPEGATTSNNDWLISPVLALGTSGSSVTFYVKSLSSSYGLESFNVGVYTGTGVPTSGSDFTIISAASETAPFGVWGEVTIDLSAYNNQDIRIGIHNTSADVYMLMVDDFSVITATQTDIQTTVNTATAANMEFKGTGNAYAYDATTGNVMARLQNNDAYDYGCLNVSVSREGTGSQLFENPDPTEFVMNKTFTLAATNSNTTGNATATFYFTEAEIAGWETATGKPRADLYILREVDGTVQEVVAATVAYFNNNVTLQAGFTDLNGTFYFGPLNASLSVENNLANNFSMFPNPVSNQLTIKAANNLLPDSYAVYNMLGQVVLSKSVQNESDLLINTSGLSNGMYFIRLTQNANQIALPFIKK